MCKRGIVNNAQKENGKELELKYYNASKHYWCIVVWMLLLAVFVIGAIVGIVFCINYFSKLSESQQEYNLFTDNFTPNFLAGMIGIIFGFMFELIFIERLRCIKKYEGLRDCLIDELKSIGNICIHTISDISHEQIIKQKNKEGNEITYIIRKPEIKVFTLINIVSSPENQSTFYSLPRYIKGTLRGEHAKKLHDIIMVITSIIFNINNLIIKDTRNVVELRLFKKLLIYVKDFLLATDCYLKKNILYHIKSNLYDNIKKNFNRNEDERLSFVDLKNLIKALIDEIITNSATFKFGRKDIIDKKDIKFLKRQFYKKLNCKEKREIFKDIKKQIKDVKPKRKLIRKDLAEIINKQLTDFIDGANDKNGDALLPEVKAYF